MYGPLAAIAHTTGQLQGALAGAKRVRAMFALIPETVDAPDAIDAADVTGDVRFERVGFKFGKWHDVGWWQRALHDPRAPEPPIPFDELRSLTPIR